MPRFIKLLFLLTLLQGCTTAGPYVTNISSDGNNGLNIERCFVYFNGVVGTVSTGDCSSQNIKLRSN